LEHVMLGVSIGQVHWKQSRQISKV